MFRLPLIACALTLGCATARVPPSSSRLASVAAEPSLPLVPPTASAASSTEPLAPAPAHAELVESSPKLELEVTHVLTAPITDIALGDGTRVAVLADPPQVGDARGFKPLPLPKALAQPAAGDHAQIFFGRDNEPRIMGALRSGASEQAIYWRHTSAGWRDGREEIGQLGGTLRGGLWGVLGGSDPELVCRCNAVCIIKRNSGWKLAPAGSTERRVSLQQGALWGLDATGIASIDEHGWALAIPAPSWSEPRTFWATRDEAWVSTDRELFHYHAGAWTTVPLPIAEVAAWWDDRADSVWLVGSGGVAHFDGRRFRVASAFGVLRAIRGRADGDVWFGGDVGLFHARLEP